MKRQHQQHVRTFALIAKMFMSGILALQIQDSFHSGVDACATNCANCTTSGSGLCEKCKQGFRLNNSTHKCQAACGSNCNSCPINGQGLCDPGKCSEGYTFNSTKQCQRACRAGPGCLTCRASNSAECTSCQSGLGLSLIYPYSCQACNFLSSTCANCSTLKLCTKCVNAAYVPYKNGTAACAPCSKNCATCSTSGPGLCDKCNTGYKINNSNQCDACLVSNCALCTNDVNTCTTCISRYFIVAGSNRTQCAKCSANCTGCATNGGNFCDAQKCSATYGYNSTTKFCEPCSTYCSQCKVSGAQLCDGAEYCAATDSVYNSTTQKCDASL